MNSTLKFRAVCVGSLAMIMGIGYVATRSDARSPQSRKFEGVIRISIDFEQQLQLEIPFYGIADI